jgi:hypothetical protein
MRVDVYLHLAPADPRLDQLIAAVNLLRERISAMSDSFNSELQQLQNDVANNNDVVQSAVTALNGIADQIQAAVQKALQAGATADQLAALNKLHQDLSAQSASLAQAVAANTTQTQSSGGATTGTSGADTTNQVPPADTAPTPGAA